ncbi:MAG: iron-sulfur cluster repair di-iron protein [Candidatus Acidiferrum sp.]
MQLLDNRTVRDVASANPGAARIFEKFGIDYCCGGERSLAQACSSAKVNLQEVAEALEKPQSQSGDRDWQKVTLAELAKHIVAKHHEYVRQEIQRLIPLSAKVAGVHGKNHPELETIQSSFQALAEELTAHLMKEERILFPYIEQLELAANFGSPLAASPFGTVKNPVRMMMMEHDSAGELLRKMREASGNYALPADACTSFQMLYRALEEFEADLHQHIHLENNILFPRAIELEAKTA